MDNVKKKTASDMYDRLSWVLSDLDKNPSAASIEIGYRSRNALREVLDKSKEREFTSTLLIRLYTHYKVNPNWILLGIDEPYLS
jgi:hypothetical protein